MTQLDIALATFGAFVLIIGLFSNYLRKTIISENLLALLLGILISPAIFGWLDHTAWGDPEMILEQAARFSLAIGLIGVALRLPTREFRRYWKPLATLVALVMPLMWLSNTLIVYLLLDLPFWVAALIGAVITPTDPIVASSIVTGEVAERYLPERVRQTISGESGLNDGLAYPFVILPVLMLTRPEGGVVSEMLLHVLLWQVGGAVLAGGLIGYGAGRLLEWAEAHHAIETTSFLGYTLALSVSVLGAATLIGTEAILAAFVAGVAFDMGVTDKDRIEEERVQEAVNRFFTLPIFVLVGLTIPWDGWREIGWIGLLVVISVLLLRRIPAVLLLRPLLGSLRNYRDTIFIGWFGPVAIAALYYASMSRTETGLDEVWNIASLVIVSSVVVHGITATPLTRRYGTPGDNGHASA